MKNYKTFYEKFNCSKSLVDLAIRLLSENYIKIIYLKHSESLISEESVDLTPCDLSCYYLALSKTNDIVEFLEGENVDEEKAKILLNDGEKLEELKKLYREKHKKAREYKSFFSNFKEPEYLVRLAIMMTPDTYKETLYKKYGQNLTDTTSKLELTLNDTKKISTRFINIIKTILEFLKSKNLSEQEVELILSDKEKLKALIEEFKYSKKKTRRIFSLFTENESIIRLSLTFLTYEQQEFLKSIIGIDYNDYITLKSKKEEKQLKITKSRIETILKYLKSFEITEEIAESFLEGKNLSEYIKLKINFRPNISFYNSLEYLEIEEKFFSINKMPMLYSDLARINITPNDVSLLLENEEALKLVEKECEKIIKSNLPLSGPSKSFYSKFNENKILVLLASRLLKEKEKNILYKKYDKNLSSPLPRRLSNNEKGYLYNVIIPHMKKILEFLNNINLSLKQVAYLLSPIGKEDLELLKSKYYSTKNRKASRKASNNILIGLLDIIKKTEYLVRLAILFLPEEYRNVIFQKYDKDLNKIPNNKLSGQVKNKISYAIVLMKSIIEYLENKDITEENYLYLISEEGKEDLEKLKNEYYKLKISKSYIMGNCKRYKSFFSYFNCPKHITKFAVLFLEEKYKNLLYKKYDKDLENIKLKEDISNVDTSTIYNLVIPKIQEIIDFLDKENISDKHICYLCSEKGTEDLRTLIKMYNTKRRIKRYKKVIFPSSKNYSDEEKILILLQKYEGNINIGMLSEILNINKTEVFDTYVTYKLKQ